MLICTSQQREQKIHDWVQTLLNITDEGDLIITSVEPESDGFLIKYKYFQYDSWEISDIKLYISQILLMESLK
jgi:hypothetical protein